MTTLQLARALAQSGRRVTLVDLDLRSSAHDARGARRPARDHVRRPGSARSPTPSSRSRSTRWTRPALPLTRTDVGTLARSSRSSARSSRPSVRDLELDCGICGSCRAEQRADVVLVEAAPVLDFPDAAAVAPRPGRAPPRRERSGRPRADVGRGPSRGRGWPLVGLGFALHRWRDARLYGRQASFGMFGTRAKAGEKEQVL